jgi:predicted DNA-binding protein
MSESPFQKEGPVDFEDLDQFYSDPKIAPPEGGRPLTPAEYEGLIDYLFGSRQVALEFAGPGRPRLDEGRQASPSVRTRLTPETYDQLRSLAKQSGRSVSELLREGVELVLAKAAMSARMRMEESDRPGGEPDRLVAV